MGKYKIEISFERFESIDQLSKGDANLMRAAIDAAGTAYAPYSNFRVGAALQLDDGSIIKGSNQENAAYPACICAERVALTSKAVSHPHQKIKTIAVVSFLSDNEAVHPAAPCGECRQMIAEFENRQQMGIRIIMQIDENTILIAPSIESILPFHFKGNDLK